MRVLVIGGTSLLGSRLVEMGREMFDMHGTYRAHAVKRSNFYKLDVTDHQKARDLIEEVSPGAVVNTAALSSPDRCEVDSKAAKAINTDAAENIARACAAIGAHCVYLSTAQVFDGMKGSPYDEGDEPNPVGKYGSTKLAGEKAVLESGADALVARTSVIYGWNDSRLNFATWALGELEQKRPVHVPVDHVRTPTFVDSLAAAVLKSLEMRATGLYHIAGSEATDKCSFVATLAEVFGADKSLIRPVKSTEARQRAKTPLSVPLAVSKAEGSLDVRMLSVREGLERMRAARS